MMTPKDLQDFQRFTADLLSHATNEMKAGKSVDEATARSRWTSTRATRTSASRRRSRRCTTSSRSSNATKTAFLAAALAAVFAPVHAQPGAALPAPGFHHLHLNSMNPDAAIAFYAKEFPSTSKATWGGMPALKSPNNVLVLFTKVEQPPATQPQTAVWHFGWHVHERARDDGAASAPTA